MRLIQQLLLSRKETINQILEVKQESERQLKDQIQRLELERQQRKVDRHIEKEGS